MCVLISEMFSIKEIAFEVRYYEFGLPVHFYTWLYDKNRLKINKNSSKHPETLRKPVLYHLNSQEVVFGYF